MFSIDELSYLFWYLYNLNKFPGLGLRTHTFAAHYSSIHNYIGLKRSKENPCIRRDGQCLN